MPTEMSKDTFHRAVKTALQKDNWNISHDPLPLKVGKVNMSIDLGAEKVIAAEKEQKKIAVEIKSFVSDSVINEFHTALGQYLNYRKALKETDPDRKLFLAVPFRTYTRFFLEPFVQETISEHEILLVIYNPLTEEIVQWKE